MKKGITIIILLLTGLSASAQFYLNSSVEIGSNNTATGVFGRPTAIAAYRMGNFHAQLGFQAKLGSISSVGNITPSYYSGFYTDLKRNFKIKEFPFSVSFFFLHNQFSNLINEFDFGLLGAYEKKHIEIHLGVNSRIYALEREGDYENADPDADLRIYEYRNFMYKGILWLHEVSTFQEPNWDYLWNVGISLTNFDQFRIQQETNPMLTALFQYELEREFIIYSEFWYQGAGMLNLSANYFGFYFKAGFKWQIN